MIDWTNAEAANGPLLAQWLEERFAGRLEQANALHRLKRWRNGGQATFHTLDDLLVKLDVHPSQLPDGVWENLRPKNLPRVAA